MYKAATERLLRKLGITANYLGYHYLVKAIPHAIEDPSCLTSVTKQLYVYLAGEFDTSLRCIERNIRTAIDVCWEHGNRLLLDEVAGYHLTERPTNSTFISLLASCVSESVLI